MTTVNYNMGSEIDVHPGKGTINHDQINTPVYYNSFGVESKPIDHFKEERERELYETTEECDEETEIHVNHALRALMKAFNMPDGGVNVRRQEKYEEALELIHEAIGTLVKKKDTVAAQPIRGTDRCHIHDKLIKKCWTCLQKRDISYCMDECEYCKEHRELMEQADRRTYRNIYAQRSKIAITKSTTTVTNQTAAVIKPTTAVISSVPMNIKIFNRNGNFIDKFLAVTYTIKDTDIQEDNRRYLEQALISNFGRLTQIKDMPCKGYTYVTGNTKEGVPYLHGLVRMSTEKIKKSISATDTRFKGRNRITINGRMEEREEKLKMLLKPIDVSEWIAFMKDKGDIKGNMENIIEGWELSLIAAF